MRGDDAFPAKKSKRQQQRGKHDSRRLLWLSNPIFPRNTKKKDFKEFALPPAGAQIGGKTFGGYKEMFFNEALLTEAREVRGINASLTSCCCDDGLLDGVPQRTTHFPRVGTKNEFPRKAERARLHLSPCLHTHHVCFNRTFSGKAPKRENRMQYSELN